MRLRKILAAVEADASDASALCAATRLATAALARLAVPGASGGPAPATLVSAEPVIVREGDPVAEILNVVRNVGIELLVFGHHRGGPSNGQETGSVAARLLARAPCAVLTVPI